MNSAATGKDSAVGDQSQGITITVLVDTVFKKMVLGSQDLIESEKAQVAAGLTLPVDDLLPDRNQHVKIRLAGPLMAADGKTSLHEVYAYEPHLKIEGISLEKVIKLPVPYRRQTDNDTDLFGPGWRQCNLTSNTMLADYLLEGELTRKAKEKGLREPESLYAKALRKYGDTIDHNAQTSALKEFGIESYYSRNLTAEEILLSLRNNVPVVLGFAYKGSGHICLLVGHDPIRRVWLVHDPYGTRHGYTDSYDIGIGGSYDPYTYGTMQMVFWDRGGASGEGRIVTSVKGKPTGLPVGL